MAKETKSVVGMQLFKPVSHHLQGLSLGSDGAINHVDTSSGGTQESVSFGL